MRKIICYFKQLLAMKDGTCVQYQVCLSIELETIMISLTNSVRNEAFILCTTRAHSPETREHASAPTNTTVL